MTLTAETDAASPVASPTRPPHPLIGANVSTLVRLVAENGWPSRRFMPDLALAGLSALVRAPASALEAGYMALGREAGGERPPVFIVGHWRSGTTHLFNLLSGGGDVAYATPVSVGLPWDFVLLGRALAPLLNRAIPAGRGIDAMAVTPESPQEDELALASMTRPSYYHGIYFPRHFARHMAAGLFFDGCDVRARARWQKALHGFTEKIARRHPGRQILVKNPAHSAKIDAIREIWPEARFIHAVRDPHAVLVSTRRMFADLLDMLALQDHDPAEVERAIVAAYPRMMDKLAADAESLPEECFAEVRFEDLEQDPLAEVARLAPFIDPHRPEDILRGAERHMAQVAGYEKRTRAIDPEVAATVGAHWAAQLERWNYPRRDKIASNEGF